MRVFLKTQMTLLEMINALQKERKKKHQHAQGNLLCGKIHKNAGPTHSSVRLLLSGLPNQQHNLLLYNRIVSQTLLEHILRIHEASFILEHLIMFAS